MGRQRDETERGDREGRKKWETENSDIELEMGRKERREWKAHTGDREVIQRESKRGDGRRETHV